MQIVYELNPKITVEEFVEALNSSTLGERRPVDDIDCIKGMIENADIIITANINDEIIGVARAVTDFNYCCYLSDLAVSKSYQSKGIGKRLIQKTKEQLGKKCKIILLSAPNAKEYYPKIGFSPHNSAWTLASTDKLR